MLLWAHWKNQQTAVASIFHGQLEIFLIYSDNFQTSFLPLLLPGRLPGPQKRKSKMATSLSENTDPSADRGNKFLEYKYWCYIPSLQPGGFLHSALSVHSVLRLQLFVQRMRSIQFLFAIAQYWFPLQWFQSPGCVKQKYFLHGVMTEKPTPSNHHDNHAPNLYLDKVIYFLNLWPNLYCY